MFSDKFAQMPDVMSSSDVATTISEILEVAEKSGAAIEAQEIAEALCEMADRQWHTYTRLNNQLCGRIGQWLHRNWDPQSVDFVEKSAFIAGHLGLRDVLADFRVSLKAVDLPEQSRAAIIAAIHELDKTIDDPFSGMRTRPREP